MKCVKCSAENSEEANFCAKCGFKFKPLICNSCGKVYLYADLDGLCDSVSCRGAHLVPLLGFVSYRRRYVSHKSSSESNEVVIRLKERVEKILSSQQIAGGFFYDKAGIEREDFEEKISRTISACRGRVFLLVLTPGALDPRDEEDWMRREIGLAIKYGLEIIPVMAANYMKDDRFELPNVLPEEFRAFTKLNINLEFIGDSLEKALISSAQDIAQEVASAIKRKGFLSQKDANLRGTEPKKQLQLAQNVMGKATTNLGDTKAETGVARVQEKKKQAPKKLEPSIPSQIAGDSRRASEQRSAVSIQANNAGVSAAGTSSGSLSESEIPLRPKKASAIVKFGGSFLLVASALAIVGSIFGKRSDSPPLVPKETTELPSVATPRVETASNTPRGGGSSETAPFASADMRDSLSPDSSAMSPEKSNALETPETVVAKMLDASARNADAEVKEARVQGDSLPKPERGNRKVARALNNEAASLLKELRFIEAVDLLKRAHTADPADVEIVDNLSYAALKAGDLAEAKRSAMSALAIAPGRSSAWAGLGLILAETAIESQAVAAFANAYRFSGNTVKTIEYLDKLAAEDASPKVKAAASKALQVVKQMTTEP